MPANSKDLQKRHPDRPWMWRKDWASGRIDSAQGAVAVVASVFAIVFTGFGVPLVLKAPEIVEQEGFGALAMAGAFGLGAIGTLYWATTATARWFRFRGTHLELVTLPGVVGGRFEAIAHLGTVIAPSDGFRARLTCLRRRRSGKNTDDSAIWQHEITIPSVNAQRGPHGSMIRVGFDIPFECEPTSPAPERLPSVRWRLEIDAELPGADFASVFEVPVFKTEASSADVSERVELAEASTDSDAIDSIAAEGGFDDPRIRLARSPEGAIEIDLPASRNRAGAAMLTGFALAWNGFLYAASGSMPGLFKLFLLPFVLVGVLLALLVPAAWLQSTTLHAARGELAIRRRMLGKGSQRVIRTESIEAIYPESQGGNTGRTNWSVRVREAGRSKARAAASNLGSKADAQRMAALLAAAIRRPD